MSTIKSSTEHLTLNADGSGKDIKFQANGVEKASISSVGAFTSTSIDATKLSGTVPNFTSTGIDDNATSTAITIDASENVGISVVPESDWYSLFDALQVNMASSFAGYGTGTTFGTILSTNSRNTGNSFVATNKYIGSSYATLYLQDNVGKHIFYTAPSGTADATISFTPAMTITNGGKVLVGTSSAFSGSYAMSVQLASGTGGIIMKNYNTALNIPFKFLNSSASTVGTISASTTATAYNTSSDYRLKEDDQPMVGSIDRLKSLRPINFAWKVDGSRTDGFLAHEAGEVVPECATGTKDAMMDEEYEVTPAVMDGDTVVTEAVMGTRSVPDYQGIDQSKLVPLLVASLQEAVARIEVLENA